MANDELYEKFAYVTYNDIKKLHNITDHKDSTLLAIRAPPGTKLEIPDVEITDWKNKNTVIYILLKIIICFISINNHMIF